MNHGIPQGVTTPAPGQEKEEPDLWQEDDIPADSRGNAAATDEHGKEPAQQPQQPQRR